MHSRRRGSAGGGARPAAKGWQAADWGTVVDRAAPCLARGKRELYEDRASAHAKAGGASFTPAVWGGV